MKKAEIILFSLLSAVLLAVNTDWCKPAKSLVIVCSVAGIVAGFKEISEAWSERK